MKKMISKLLSVVLVMTMVVTMFVGCGKSSSSSEDTGSTTEATPAASETTEATEAPKETDVSKMPVVKFAAVNAYDVSDATLVQDAMNKILAERYGIQCQLSFIGFGSWIEQSNLLLTGDEVDVTMLFMLPLSTYAHNGQLLALDDYVANSSDAFKAIWTQEQLNGCKVDGVQYSIPNLRNFGNTFDFACDEAILTELGYKPEDVNSLDKVEEVLNAFHAKYPDRFAIVPQSQATMVNGWTWDGLGDQNNVGVIGNCGQDTTVMNLYDTEDFKNLVSYTHRWYEAGLVMGDALSNQDTGPTLVQNGKAFGYLTNSGPDAPAKGLVRCNLIPAWADGANINALSYGINALSSHPDEAWTFLQALYTDADLATLLIDGIEGTHYTKNADGTISYPEGVTPATSTYGNATAYWAYPYAANIPVITDLGGADYFKNLIAFNNSCTPSKSLGFAADTSSVTDEYTACINVMDKYTKGLMCGMLDPETVIPQADQELKDAGIDKIITAKQEQLDAFLAAK